MSYSDTPWTSTLAAGLVGTVGGVLIGKYFGMPSVPGAPGAIPATGIIKDTITYIPHILLLFGLLADMVTYDLVYVIPTIVGLLSVVLNYGMKYFWAGVAELIETVFGATGYFPRVNPRVALLASRRAAAAATGAPAAPAAPTQAGGGAFFNEYDGCSLQGLGFLASPYAPQTLVITATIFSYLMFDLITNRGWKNASATIIIFTAAYFGQAFTIGDCKVGDLELGKPLRALAALTEGLLFGGASFAVVNTYFPERLPSSTISPFPRRNKSELKPNASGVLTDSDGNPYICLPNGQCMPDLSSDEARSRYAQQAAENLGTGGPAMPGSCPS